MLWWFPEGFQASQVCSLCSCAIFAVFFVGFHCFLSFGDRNLRVELIDRKVKAVTWEGASHQKNSISDRISLMGFEGKIFR